MYKLLLSITLFVTLAANPVYKLTEAEIVAFNNKFTKEVINEIARIYKMKPPKKLDVLPVPYCAIDPSVILTNSLGDFTNSVAIDQSQGYAIVRDQNGVILGTVQKQSLLTFFPISKIQQSQLQQVKLIEHVANKYSKSIFIISSSNFERKYFVGFFVSNDSVSFVGENFELIDGPTALIIREYGSREKFLEILKMQERNKSLLNDFETIEKAKDFLKRDYIFYQETFPDDTSNVMKLLLEEIAYSCNATPSQLGLISREIERAKMANILPEFNGLGVPFYGRDIYLSIKSVLTADQFQKFIDTRQINAWLS